MKRFYRIGELLSEVVVSGVPLTDYSIVWHTKVGAKAPPEVEPSYARAAWELQTYLARMTDLSIPVLNDNNPLRTKGEFLIGPVRRDVREDKTYGDDEFIVKTVGTSVIIDGGKRGILYGVYAFLEACGVRFFTKDCERVLWKEKIEVAGLDIHGNTPFEYRDICCWTGWNPEFCTKVGVNGNFGRKLYAEHGDSVGHAGGFAGLVHTSEQLIPPGVYYRDHPDWFCLTEDGKRDPTGICYSNEEVFREMLKNAKAWLAAEPDPRLISISINDGNVGYCRCEKCRKIIERGGNNTDLVLDFVNRMAAEIHKSYPNVVVDTISYGGTRELPKITKAGPGVAVQVCGQGGERRDPLPKAAELKVEGRNSAKDYLDRIIGWGKITDKIYVWDYPYNYPVINAPFPVLHSILGTMRFYADHKVTGVYINGETDCAEFSELKFYLLAKAMMNPYMTDEEYEVVMDEFLEGVYGAGWKEIKKFIVYSEKEATPLYTTGFPDDNIPLKRLPDGSADETFIRRSREMFDRAYTRAHGDGERRRVKKAAYQVEYYDLYLLMREKMKKGSEKEREELVRRNREMYEDFIRMGVTRVRENCFLPVVKNFAQPPEELLLWDYASVTGDRNNENYARSLYVLVPFDLPLGTKVDFSCLYRTNNENDEGFLGVVGENGEIVESKLNPRYGDGREEDEFFREIVLRGGVVTTGDEFAEKSGLPRNGLMLGFLPIHLRGVIVRVRSMDAGAYLFIRSPKILP